jgi:hypothetical protein
MAMWKHFIVLFGGFYDLGVRTNYLDDLWIFDTQEYKWKQIEFGLNVQKPRCACFRLRLACFVTEMPERD